MNIKDNLEIKPEVINIPDKELSINSADYQLIDNRTSISYYSL